MSKEKKTEAPKIEIKRPPVLFGKTQKLITKIREQLNGDFMSYWISDRGNIVDNDLIAFYNVLKDQRKSDTLYLFIKSDGGNGQASLRIINLLRHFYKNIVALVTLDCASAATMMALGANKIMMGPLAYLSAIDTSITHDLSPIDKDNDRVSVSQVELSRVLKLWEDRQQDGDGNPYKTLYAHVHPLVFGAVDRASSLSIRLTSEILSYHIADTAEAQRISEHLNSEYPSHGYPITLREAQKIGLNAEAMNPDINALLLEINEHYSEMAQKALTHFDKVNNHDNEILKVLETQDLQLFYQQDKDWHYRQEEGRWVSMNDSSCWHRIEPNPKGGFVETKFYIN